MLSSNYWDMIYLHRLNNLSKLFSKIISLCENIKLTVLYFYNISYARCANIYIYFLLRFLSFSSFSGLPFKLAGRLWASLSKADTPGFYNQLVVPFLLFVPIPRMCYNLLSPYRWNHTYSQDHCHHHHHPLWQALI